MLATHAKATIKSLKQDRDELLGQLPMANTATREQWLHLEEKWDQLLFNIRAIAHDDLKYHGNIEMTMDMLSKDLQTGYMGMRQVLH